MINQFNSLPNWANEILENYRNLKKNDKKAKGLPRAHLALPSYQKFRILSEVNNLKIVDPNKTKIDLIPEEKQIIIDILNSQKSAGFSKLRKAIANNKNNYDTDDFEFNFESDKRKSLIGDETSYLLSKIEYFGEKWFEFNLAKQDEIVEFIIEAQNPEEILEKAQKEWKLSSEQNQNLSKLTPANFKSGIGNLSKEILQRLVKEISTKYCRYDEAVKNLLGFNHSSSKTLEEIENTPLSKQLEYYGKILQTSTVPVKYGSQEEIDFGRIANPTVHVALNQLRKVINSLIECYGNPKEINIELARELKLSKDEKRQMEIAQTKNQKENERIAAELIKANQSNNYDNRLKFKLWEELAKDPNDRKCIYSGQQMGISKLFSNEIEVEHILPFSKTFDDSIKNKTIAFRSANQDKREMAPFEAFSSSNSYNYEEIKARAELLPKNKSWRFFPNAMEKFNNENEFIARQLNDTRYLSRIAKQYLAHICRENKISVTNGQLTSLLRHHWGLNSILNKEENLKSRDDHRHHAVDAIVIGMTDRVTLNKISTAKNYYSKIKNDNFEKVAEKFRIDKPWENFRHEAEELINKIIVSYKTDHTANSELHSQTYYGILKEKIFEENSKKDPFNIVTSKVLAGLKKTEISRIRDKRIRQEIEELTKHLSKDKKDEKALAQVLKEYSDKTGIKNIRILDKTKTIIKISHPTNNPRFEKAISPDGNNHITVWQMPNGEFITDPVSHFRMNSIYEIKEGADGINFVNKNKKFTKDPNQKYEKLKPHPAAKLIIRLFKDDLVRLEEKGEIKTVRIGVIGSNTQCKYFDNTIFKKEGTFYLGEKSLREKKIRKIYLTPSGKVYDSGPILK